MIIKDDKDEQNEEDEGMKKARVTYGVTDLEVEI